MAKKFLIFGGAGYLGARIAETLSAHGHVVATSRTLTPAKKSWAKSFGSKLELRAFDSHAHSISGFEQEYDCILNLATPSSAEAAKDPAGARAGAIASVEAALHLLKEGCAKRIIHFSSFHVYGNPGQTSYREKDFAMPTHPYGEAHLACEENLRSLIDHAPVVVLRPTNIVGAPAHGDLGMQQKLFFLDCCRQAATEGTIKINNDGSAQRDFLPFSDALAAIGMVATAEKFPAGFYNLGLGKSQTLKTFLSQIQTVASEVLKKKISISFGDASDPFTKAFQVDVGLLKAAGWKPSAEFADEVKDAITFYRRMEKAA